MKNTYNYTRSPLSTFFKTSERIPPIKVALYNNNNPDGFISKIKFTAHCDGHMEIHVHINKKYRMETKENKTYDLAKLTEQLGTTFVERLRKIFAKVNDNITPTIKTKKIYHFYVDSLEDYYTNNLDESYEALFDFLNALNKLEPISNEIFTEMKSILTNALEKHKASNLSTEHSPHPSQSGFAIKPQTSS